jgi:hypothetical protein
VRGLVAGGKGATRRGMLAKGLGGVWRMSGGHDPVGLPCYRPATGSREKRDEAERRERGEWRRDGREEKKR